MLETVRIELLKNTAALEAFAPQWHGVWQADEAATPFQSPAWMLPWWHQFGQAETRTAVVFGGDQPVALLPFYVYPEPNTGERKLLLIGAGTTDYLDGLFAPACSAQHVQLGLDALREAGGWDTIAAMQLRPGSLLYSALRAYPGAEMFASESCSQVPASTMADLPVKIRRKAMYYRNRALRLGELRFHVADARNCLNVFSMLQTLHTQRWNARGEAGVLADERVLAMHREAVPRLQAEGLLRLCSLMLGEETLGVLYSFIDPPGRKRRTQYIYLTAFSGEHAELRPGTLLLAYAIEHAAREGIAVVDMLRGDEAYKEIWHAARIPTFGIVLPANNKERSTQHE